MAKLFTPQMEEIINEAKKKSLVPGDGRMIDSYIGFYNSGVEAMANRLEMALMRADLEDLSRDTRGKNFLAAEPAGGDDQPDADGEG